MERRKSKHLWLSECRIPSEKSGPCYCKSSNKFFFEKYPKSQNYNYAENINKILREDKCIESINFRDDECFIYESNLLNR